MSKLAQVAAEQSHSDYFHIDMHQFNDGGVSEITPVRESEVLSMEQFLKAEERLAAKSDIDVGESTTIEHTAEILQLFRTDYGKGHDISHNRDLQTAHIGHTGDEGNYIEGKIYNYSVADTVAEQNGKPSDADITTAGGYLKKGISDPGAHQENKKKKRSSQRLIQVLNDQDVLNQYLEHLDEHIKDLQNKIKEYDNQTAEMNDVLDVLESGDINANSGVGRARRGKINAWAKENNVDLDKFKKADGSLDQSKLQEFVSTQRDEIAIQREQAQVKKEILVDKRAKVIKNYDENQNITLAALKSGDQEKFDSIMTTLSESDKVRVHEEMANSNETPLPKDINTIKEQISQMNNSYMYYSYGGQENNNNFSRTNGSFANGNDSVNNVITAAFTMASNNEANTTQPQDKAEHQTSYTTVNSPSQGVM